MEKTYTFFYNGHEATVIVPDNANGEWIWKTEFLYAFDAAERALLEKGYTRVYYSVSDKYGSPEAIRLMRAFFFEVTTKFSLRGKCHLFGFSRGGLYAFNFALFYPELVASVYLDAPVLDLKSWPLSHSEEQRQMFGEYALNEDTLPLFHENPADNFGEFFSLGLPVLLVAGAKDSLVAFTENSGALLKYCTKHKIAIESYIKPNGDHHPHSLSDVSPIERFVVSHSFKH